MKKVSPNINLAKMKEQKVKLDDIIYDSLKHIKTETSPEPASTPAEESTLERRHSMYDNSNV